MESVEEDKKKILIVTQEMKPYLAISEIAEIARKLPQYISDSGMDIRVMMPRFGLINERRHRLHEVVRLSGLNLVVNDDDYPLIIKVATLPGVRMQVYFLDNEEFFKRKFVFEDESGNEFEDNLERTAFFCKAVVETTIKMGWKPDIIHCHGWMTSLVPTYIANMYKDEPMLEKSKIIYSLYDYELEIPYDQSFIDKTGFEDEDNSFMSIFDGGQGKVNFHLAAAKDSDGVIIASEFFEDEELEDKIKAVNGLVLEYKDEQEYLPAYINFYKNLIE